MIFDVFDPDIRFVWVQPEDISLQKKRLDTRAAQYGNPINADVYEYMLAHWESPQLPHAQLINGPSVASDTKFLLQKWGLCYGWDL